MKRVKCIESLILSQNEIFLLYFYLMKKCLPIIQKYSSGVNDFPGPSLVTLGGVKR